jgi:hypothetical protein
VLSVTTVPRLATVAATRRTVPAFPASTGLVPGWPHADDRAIAAATVTRSAAARVRVIANLPGMRLRISRGADDTTHTSPRTERFKNFLELLQTPWNTPAANAARPAADAAGRAHPPMNVSVRFPYRRVRR